ARVVVFFQAEDGIRDFHVTGVQTCALPILDESGRLVEIRAYLQDVTRSRERERVLEESVELMRFVEAATQDVLWDWDIRRGTLRSEERRVGKECRARRVAEPATREQGAREL